MNFDLTDRKIINILQSNARITNVQLAAKAGISPPAMLERVKRLENSGVIRKYAALLDPNKIDRGTFAFVSVSLTLHQGSTIDSFTKEIKKLNEVLECYHIAGEADFIMKVAVNNIEEYESFMLKKLTTLKGVNKINTTFVLSSIKYNTQIFLPENSENK